MPYIAKNLSHFSVREIRALFKKGMRAYYSPQLDIILMPTTGQFGRILVVTSRKIGTAPERNTIRRRLKALFYQKAFYEHNLDVCIIMKKPGISYTCKELGPLLNSVIMRYKKP